MGQAERSAHPGTKTEGRHGQVQKALVHVQEDAHVHSGQLYGCANICDGGNVCIAGPERPLRTDYRCCR